MNQNHSFTKNQPNQDHQTRSSRISSEYPTNHPDQTPSPVEISVVSAAYDADMKIDRIIKTPKILSNLPLSTIYSLILIQIVLSQFINIKNLMILMFSRC